MTYGIFKGYFSISFSEIKIFRNVEFTIILKSEQLSNIFTSPTLKTFNSKKMIRVMNWPKFKRHLEKIEI